jgi:hypothetical protein
VRNKEQAILVKKVNPLTGDDILIKKCALGTIINGQVFWLIAVGGLKKRVGADIDL